MSLFHKKQNDAVNNQYETDHEQNTISDQCKFAAEDIYNLLVKAIKEPSGRINVNTELLWMSGMAGLICQMTVWEKLRLKNLPMEAGFVVVETKDGQKYYMGNMINQYLLEGNYSIWSLVSGLYHSWEPEKPIPDFETYVVNAVNNIGNSKYKIWGYINPKEMTGPYRAVWNVLESRLRKYCKDQEEWPIVLGMAIQMAMNDAKKVLSAQQCVDMVMENLLFMSKMAYFG